MKSPNPRKNVPWYISIILCSISMLSSLAILITVLYMIRYLSPVDANAKPMQLKIAPGMSSMAIANQLAHKNLIHNPWAFLFVTHLSDVSHRLQVGTYCLSGAMSIPQIIDQLKTGKVDYTSICGSRRFNRCANWKTLGKRLDLEQQQRSTKLRAIPNGGSTIKLKRRYWRVTYSQIHTNFLMEQRRS